MKRSLFALIVAFGSWGCSEKQVEPDPQFILIHLKYGWANELNTFEQTFQKDLVLDGVATTDFWFTTKEQEEILAEVESVNFFSLPDTVGYNLVKDTIALFIQPHPGWQHLRIRHDNQEKIVSWYDLNIYEDEYSASLSKLVRVVIEIIELKPAYQALPPAKGGYV